MNRIVEGKGILELSRFHTEEVVFLPFGEEVYHARRRSQRGCVAVELQLGFPVPVVKDAAVERDTSQTQIESVRLVGLSVVQSVVLVLHDTKAGQPDIIDPLRCLRIAEG